jgi:hypothetical protein
MLQVESWGNGYNAVDTGAEEAELNMGRSRDRRHKRVGAMRGRDWLTCDP